MTLVAGAADAKIRLWRIKHRRLQTAAEVFSPALYIRARVVRDYVRDSAARSIRYSFS